MGIRIGEIKNRMELLEKRKLEKIEKINKEKELYYNSNRTINKELQKECFLKLRVAD